MDNERNAWSDLSGSVQLSPKEDMTAPKGYRWTQDNWKLDTAGPWIDDTLGIGKCRTISFFFSFIIVITIIQIQIINHINVFSNVYSYIEVINKP